MSPPITSIASLSPAVNYGMRPCTRYITTHDSSGHSILVPVSDLLFREKTGTAVARAYSLSSIPATIADNQDLQSYLSEDGNNAASHTLAGQQTTVANGINVTYFNLAPGAETAMHRTVSVDFTVVLEGQIEMGLDSGDKVLLHTGVRMFSNYSDERFPPATGWDIVKEVVAKLLFVGLGDAESHDA